MVWCVSGASKEKKKCGHKQREKACVRCVEQSNLQMREISLQAPNLGGPVFGLLQLCVGYGHLPPFQLKLINCGVV